jgi:hypothetical protein
MASKTGCIEDAIARDYQRVGSQTEQGFKSRVEIAFAARVQDMELNPEGEGGRLKTP